MRILMLIPSYHPIIGGAERQLEGLSRALELLNIEVVVLTRSVPGEKKTEVQGKTTIYRLPSWPYPLIFLVSVAFFLTKNSYKFDIFHVHTLNSPLFVATVIGWLKNKPVITKVTRSGNGAQLSTAQSSSIRRYMLRFVFSKVSRVIAITDDVVRELCLYGCSLNKITTIPNAVDVPRDVGRPPTLGEVNKKVSFVCVSRLISRKRLDFLINSWNEFAQMNPAATLDIIGDGNEYNSLEAMVKKMNLQNSIRLLGQMTQSQVRNKLRSADVFVLPSSSEGMSNAVLEAMSFGLPIIASNIAANRPLVLPNQNGLLFDTQEELTGQLIQLYTNTDERVSMSRMSRILVNSRFSLQKIAAEYMLLYTELTRKA